MQTVDHGKIYIRTKIFTHTKYLRATHQSNTARHSLMPPSLVHAKLVMPHHPDTLYLAAAPITSTTHASHPSHTPCHTHTHAHVSPSLRPRPHQHLVARRVGHAPERAARRHAVRLQRAELGRVVAVQHALKRERLLEVEPRRLGSGGRGFLGRFGRGRCRGGGRRGGRGG